MNSIFNHSMPRGVVGGTVICSSSASSTMQPIYSLVHAERLWIHTALYGKYPEKLINWARRTLRSHRGERISDAQVLAMLDALSRIAAGDTGESQP